VPVTRPRVLVAAPVIASEPARRGRSELNTPASPARRLSRPAPVKQNVPDAAGAVAQTPSLRVG
jgi:hypothetical protein